MRERAAKRSRELFESGFYCAESVLLAIAEDRGIDSEWIPKIATGFCSGMARTGGQCGALSGAMMGINLVTGRNEAGAPLDNNYAMIEGIRRSFGEKFGATNCGELLGVDLATEAGQREFNEKNLFENCLRYAEESTRMALQMLEEVEQ